MSFIVCFNNSLGAQVENFIYMLDRRNWIKIWCKKKKENPM